MAAKLAAIVALLFAGSALAITPMKDSETFRQHGILQKTPQGFENALEQYYLAVKQLQTASEENWAEKKRSVEKWQEIVDTSASQRHAYISRLFWYTDLESAKLAAAESGKPVLSLRMLGKLTDEFSCANSRFFRSALYANQEISDFLREHFVLHWQSVRPVPKVTIDFGDGRKIERTVTGNSAHYVLAADGKPLDVLPGLYSPKEFLAWLERADTLSVQYARGSNKEGAITQSKSDVLRGYHRRRLSQIRSEWERDLREVAPELFGGEFGRGGYGSGLYKVAGLVYIDAYTASHQAESKRKPEAPIIRAISQKPQQTDRMVSDKLWRMIADHHRGEVALDGQTIKLIRQENPAAADAGKLAFAKALTEDPVLKIVRNFEDSIALDTVQNKYLLEREIHNWFARGQVSDDIDQLNERVYAELFLTPSSDPWLGLVPPDTYTALDDGGVSLPAVADIGLPTPRQ